MDNKVDLSAYPMSAIQAFKMDPSTEWVIESTPGFMVIKHKMGCPICDASASHCMATKRSYEIRLDEKEVSHAVAEAWPELVRYQDNYYRLLEDPNALKETANSAKKKAEECRVKINELYEKLDTCRATIKNLDNQVHSLEAKLQAIKGNSDELPNHEDLILENKGLQQELDYYVGRVRHALYGKDANWATRNGYHISDIPGSDGEDDNEDQSGLPTLPEEIPEYRLSRPSVKLTCSVGKSNWNSFKVVPEAGIPAIGGSCLPHTQKESLLILLPPLLECYPNHWPTLRGTSDWVMESDIHDSEMCRLYIKGPYLVSLGISWFVTMTLTGW
ncbi:hypothetical protein M422DRAFT_273824 [Sphaerobolus stellatus SS14]|uniref:Uncharacterized protein n=1 Tax=Sphaerobolus stellatus (strain SS14) TaxID=990650 RepID=A0A0C9UIJ9_SPHS4|nr:hypothetical protein M422DRAFT_273824 [Sphaerobolus stellatus SS14]